VIATAAVGTLPVRSETPMMTTRRRRKHPTEEESGGLSTFSALSSALRAPSAQVSGSLVPATAPTIGHWCQTEPAGRSAGEDDLFDERLERSSQTRNDSFPIGGK